MIRPCFEGMLGYRKHGGDATACSKQKQMMGSVVQAQVIQVACGWGHFQHISRLQLLVEHLRATSLGNLLYGDLREIAKGIDQVVAPETG